MRHETLVTIVTLCTLIIVILMPCLCTGYHTVLLSKNNVLNQTTPTAVVFEPGPWKPLKNGDAGSSPAATSHMPSSTPAILSRRGFLNPSASEQQTFTFSRPGTLLKHREGSSSTFGLDIPDSNLRLLLDIDELSSKPSHDNFKLKVIERDVEPIVRLESVVPSKNIKYSVPLRPPSPIPAPLTHSSSSSSPSSPSPSSSSHSSPSPSASNQRKYQIGYIRATDLHSALNVGHLPPGSKAYPVPQHHQPIIKYSQPMIVKSDLGENVADATRSSSDHHTSNGFVFLSSSNSLDSHPFVPMMNQGSSASQQSRSTTSSTTTSTASPAASELDSSAQTFSKTNTRPNRTNNNNNNNSNSSLKKPSAAPAPVKSLRKSRKLKNRSKENQSTSGKQRLIDSPSTTTTTTTSTTTSTTTTSTESPSTTSEIPSSSRASSEKPSFKLEELRFEEQQKQSEVPDEPQIEDLQVQTNPIQIKENSQQEREEVIVGKQQQQQQQQRENDQQQEVAATTERAPVKTAPSGRQVSPVGRLRSNPSSSNSIETEGDSNSSSSGYSDGSSESGSNENETEMNDGNSDFDDGFELLRTPVSASQSADSLSKCAPKSSSSRSIVSGDIESMSLKDFAKKLDADQLFTTFPGSEDLLQGMIDFANTGYTLFLPSNQAISKLPRQLIKKLTDDKEELRKMIENHLSEDKRQMSSSMDSMSMPTRVNSGRLRINRAPGASIVVNGNRVIHMNAKGPAGGSVHVIDGILYPAADKNIMETMKSCNRFDGFVTLAEGTGLGDSLSTGGPYTVFVPSNEALQKIPEVDLERIRNNMTALKEFLMFHVAQGSYYSSDLQDGQFIPSLIPDQDIQVGVRVDDCNRRLVEANVSPLYRADIPASNGVIHVIDWILKPNDRDWCEGTVLPRRK